MEPKRNFDVLLIGGASGTGKTSISYPLGKLLKLNVVEVDDFQVFLESMTTPEQMPAIHYWNTHPKWQEEGVNATIQQLIQVGREMAPGLVRVIQNHLESQMPVILEGDFILPDILKAVEHPRVKAIFIHEPDQQQILANYLDREPEAGPQTYRSAVSHGYSQWLADACQSLDVPVIASRPFETVLERVVNLL